jgi:hypothetical protein
MFGISELIVGMWFLPVTLCIFIPLVILLGWSMTRLGKPMGTPDNGDEVDEPALANENFANYKN